MLFEIFLRHFPFWDVAFALPYCPGAAAKHSSRTKKIKFNSFSHWIFFSACLEDSTSEGVVSCFSSGSLLVSIKNTTVPTTLFSFPLLLNRSKFWWKGKEQSKVIGQGWPKSITSRANPLSSLLPEATIWGVWNKQSHCKTNCCKTEDCCRKELHQIHPAAPSCPISNSIFCKDPMNSELRALGGQEIIRHQREERTW